MRKKKDEEEGDDGEYAELCSVSREKAAIHLTFLFLTNSPLAMSSLSMSNDSKVCLAKALETQFNKYMIHGQ
jgi:hypothetical protein